MVNPSFSSGFSQNLAETKEYHPMVASVFAKNLGKNETLRHFFEKIHR
jgi:hypothetical protein